MAMGEKMDGGKGMWQLMLDGFITFSIFIIQITFNMGWLNNCESSALVFRAFVYATF